MCLSRNFSTPCILSRKVSVFRVNLGLGSQSAVKKSQLLLDASFVSRPCIEEATSVSTFNSFNLDISFFQCAKHGFISPDTNRNIRLVNFDMANLLFNLLAHWQNPSIQQKSVHES